MTMTKPPLGIKPESIHNMHVNYNRIMDIIAAIDRYSVAGMVIPVQWSEELYRRLVEYAESVNKLL